MSIGRPAMASSRATAWSSDVDHWNCSGATPHHRPQEGTRIADTVQDDGELLEEDVGDGLADELGEVLGEVGAVDVGSGDVGSLDVGSGEVGSVFDGLGAGELPPPDGVRLRLSRTTLSTGRPC